MRPALEPRRDYGLEIIECRQSFFFSAILGIVSIRRTSGFRGMQDGRGMGMGTNRIGNHGSWTPRLVIVAAVACFAIPAWVSGATPDCAAAQKTFKANCVACHMADGKGNAVLKSPNFTDPHWQAEHKDPELIAAVTNGRKGTAMPSWKKQFNQTQIKALVACVVRGFGKKSAPANNDTKAQPGTKTSKTGKGNNGS